MQYRKSGLLSRAIDITPAVKHVTDVIPARAGHEVKH
jgi:hypothetical protein